MIKAVLLVRMISFTVLFISTALGILAHQKSPRRWLRFFLIYMGFEAFYSVSFTFVFYSHVYLSDQPSSPSTVFILFQIITSAAVVYFAPRFLLELTGPLGGASNGGTAKRANTRRTHIAILVVPIVLTLLTLLAQMPNMFQPLTIFAERYNRFISAFFYLYLCVFFLLTFFRRKRIPASRWSREIVVFIAGAALFHLLWVVDIAFLDIQLAEQGPLRGILLTNAMYEIFWGVIAAIPAVAEISAQGSAISAEDLPGEFIREYQISAREKEVLPLLCDGMSSKDIAENLFISPRTVENHIRNIYRKCGVKRRLELVKLIGRY